MAAGRALRIAPFSGYPTAATQAAAATTAASGAAAQPTQLAPRQVPIKVYLDGEEIADHLQLRAGRLAAVSTVRRRA